VSISPGEPTKRTPGFAKADLTLTREVATPKGANAIATSDDVVWIAYRKRDGGGQGIVAGLDPRTGETLGEIEVAATPGWESGGGGMTVHGDSLWVVGSGEGPSGSTWLTQIDTNDRRVDQSDVRGEFDLEGDIGLDVAVDPSGDVWVLMFEPKPLHVVVKRFDPETRKVVATIPFESQWARRIIAIKGGIVVQDDGPNHQCVFVRIDPATNQETQRRLLPGCFSFSSNGSNGYEEASLWGGFGASIQEIDPITGTLLGDPIQARAYTSGPMVESENGSLWVSGRVTPVNVVNPRRGTIIQTDGGPKDSPIAMTVSGNRAWGVHYRRGMTIYRLSND